MVKAGVRPGISDPWKQFPGRRQVMSQEGGSCVCLGVVKTWPRSLPWSLSVQVKPEHRSASSQWQQVAQSLNLIKQGVVLLPHSVWSSRAGQEKSV